jgi:hypothetical protein
VKSQFDRALNAQLLVDHPIQDPPLHWRVTHGTFGNVEGKHSLEILAANQVAIHPRDCVGWEHLLCRDGNWRHYCWHFRGAPVEDSRRRADDPDRRAS